MMPNLSMCRDCKHWCPLQDFIGLGVCENLYARMKLIIGENDALRTAQNFGCVDFEPGKFVNTFRTKEEGAQITIEFLASMKIGQKTEEPKIP